MRQKLTQWKSTAGPRQTKLVQEAFSALQRRGASHIEIAGFVGGETRRSEVWAFCGEYSEAFMIGWEQLGKKFSWTITLENHKEVATLAVMLDKSLALCLPEVDNRLTPDDITKRDAQVEQNKKDRTAQVQKDAEEAERLKTQYPHLIQEGTDKTRGNTLAAKNIRIELARTFPGQKFSVRSSSFANGNDVRVSWTDGPTTKEVEALAGKYQYGHFNGMEDIYEYNRSVFCGTFGGTKYASWDRTISEATRAPLLAWAAERFEAGETFDCHSQDNMVHRLMVAYSLPVGAVVTGVEPTGKTSGSMSPAEFYRPTFTTSEQAKKVLQPSGTV